MQNAIRSACREGNKETTEQGREKSYLARGGGGFLRFWRCCGGSWWRRLVHEQRLPAALRLFPTVWVRSLRSSLSLRFLGFFCFQVDPSSLPVTLLCFFRSPLFLLSPSFYLFLSLSSVFFVFSLLLPSVLSRPLLLPCWSLFIEPSEWLFAVEHGEQPAGRPLGATANARPPSPAFWQRRGGWSAIVSGRWAPGERVAGRNSN